MRTAEVTHVGFSDESNWNKGRFRSIGLVTTTVAALDDLNRKLTQILTESGVREFKWQKLRQARERFAAEKMCDLAVDAALRQQLRVDVLIWDIQDSRHNIVSRDDIENLQRMYYHLFRNVLRLRWPNNAVWRLHPDEHTAMDWQTVQDCLQNAAERLERERSLFTGGKFQLRLRREFGMEEIRSVISSDQPLLQLADLFAGMAVFSREYFDEYQKWLNQACGQPKLLEDHDDALRASGSSKERFQVLQHFGVACKDKKLGVSLKSKRGLWTPNPENPLNFWMYEPQHPEDKAPRKA
ncbi:hypothetical protein HRbin18_01931 [bacterium HR18]|nr:hypothetical protein HRbin18_01931 [bacterium HR18]